MFNRSELAILQRGYASIADANERKSFREAYMKLERKQRDHVLALQSPADLTRLAEAYDKLQRTDDNKAEKAIIDQALAIKQGLASKPPLSDTDLMTQAQTMFEQGANSNDDFVRVRAWELKIGLSASNNLVSITKGKTENDETIFIATTGSSGRNPITRNVSRAELENMLQTSQAYAAIQKVTSPTPTYAVPKTPVASVAPVTPEDNSAEILKEKFTDTNDKRGFIIALKKIDDPEKKRRVLMQQRAIDLKALASLPDFSTDDRKLISSALLSTQNVTLSAGQLSAQAERIFNDGKNNLGVMQQAAAIGVTLHGDLSSVSVTKSESGFTVTTSSELRHVKTVPPISVKQDALEQLVRDNLTPAAAATISVMSVPSSTLAGSPSLLRKPLPPPPGARAPSSTEPPLAAVVQAPNVQQPPRPSTQPVAVSGTQRLRQYADAVIANPGLPVAVSGTQRLRQYADAVIVNPGRPVAVSGTQRLRQYADEVIANPGRPVAVSGTQRLRQYADEVSANPGRPVTVSPEAQRLKKDADVLRAELEQSKEHVVVSNGSDESLKSFRGFLDKINTLRKEISQFGNQSSAKEDKISAHHLVQAIDATVTAAVKVVDDIVSSMKNIAGKRP